MTVEPTFESEYLRDKDNVIGEKRIKYLSLMTILTNFNIRPK